MSPLPNISFQQVQPVQQQVQHLQQMQQVQQVQQVPSQPSVVVRNPNVTAPAAATTSVPINLQSLQGLQTLKIAPGSKLQIHTNQVSGSLAIIVDY